MSHSADEKFFEYKREWSKRKDAILEYYLAPYFPKVSKLGRPILVVDGFAGPGIFLDGEIGSPLIIAQAIKNRSKRIRQDAKALFIESNTTLFGILESNTKEYEFVDRRNCEFQEAIPEIIETAKTHQVFLYLDPFTTNGLDWDTLNQILELLRTGTSIELLLNFNACAFVRRCLGITNKPLCANNETIPVDDGETGTTVSLESLNKMVGGDWWQQVISENTNYESQYRAVTEKFCDLLRGHFNEVCTHYVFEKHTHTAPKYILVFGSRHPHALVLMNDAMRKSLKMLEESSQPSENTLFETLPTTVVPDLDKLPDIILGHLKKKMPKEELFYLIAREYIGQYSTSEIRTALAGLIKSHQADSVTHRVRPADDELVWRT